MIEIMGLRRTTWVGIQNQVLMGVVAELRIPLDRVAKFSHGIFKIGGNGDG